MKHRTLLLYLIFALPAVAQDTNTGKLLEKSEKAFKSAGAMSAYFTINIKESGSPDTQSFDGTILIKGNKFKIDAPDYDILFDGKTQWVYNKIANEVNISEPDATEVQAINPSMIYKIHRNGCNITYNGEKTDAKMRKVIEITLTPKDSRQDISQVTLQINTKDFLPVYFHVKFRNSGLDNEIFINKYDVNQNLNDSLFTFDTSKYTGVEVIDLR
jgi:outer membrane lipoprotein-sorting protein